MERNKLKYPVKYAVMSIKEQVGWTYGLNELEREYGVVANIASKCYVVGEKTEYFSNGFSKTKYEVVFPCVIEDALVCDDFDLIVPEYNFDFKCTNSIVVDELFDSFSEALKVATDKNSKVLGHKITFIPYDKDFLNKLNSVKAEHQYIIDKYKRIEEMLEDKTKDMEITHINSSEFCRVRTK